MRESSGGDKFLYFVVGAGIGAAFALLFAPKSGRETRELIAQKAQDGRDYLNTKVTESRDYVNTKVTEGRQYVEQAGRKATDDFGSFVDRSKEALSRQKEQLTAAFEAGKSAYREEKGVSE